MRKLKLLAISTLTIIMALTLAACGGDPASGPSETQSERPTNQETASTSQPATPISDPLPTKPIRLTNLGTPTAEPVSPTRSRPTTSPPGATSAPGGTNTETPEPKATAEAGAVLSPLDLIPDNPKANDTVLLQDIYDLMDLDQFALDPTKPIEKFNIPEAWKFPRSTVENHPYLHMFPDLELLTKNTKVEKPDYSRWPDVFYAPHARLGDVKNYPTGTEYFKPVDPITYFIYHPWFEQINISKDQIAHMGLDSYRIKVGRYGGETRSELSNLRNPYVQYGPYWFGKSSTRGVLSDAIAGMMKDAAYPTTELMPLKWQLGGLIYELQHPGETVTEYNWKLDDYLRTTVNRYSQDTASVTFPVRRVKYDISRVFHKHYISPEIKWEFVHPKLPIIRVTAQNSKVLPLTLPRLEKPEPTKYSVSFVISFQNRWESLDDPNRWVKRFKETPWGESRGYQHEEKYEEIPGEWHYTDYMQHKIIGPVVLQIHESPVLQPGTYSMTPNVNHWETPGHIATDAQILRPREVTPRVRDRHDGRIIKEAETALHFDDVPSSDSPNANMPLPGHVITDPTTGPGTEIWNNYKMNENEW